MNTHIWNSRTAQKCAVVTGTIGLACSALVSVTWAAATSTLTQIEGPAQSMQETLRDLKQSILYFCAIVTVGSAIVGALFHPLLDIAYQNIKDRINDLSRPVSRTRP